MSRRSIFHQLLVFCLAIPYVFCCRLEKRDDEDLTLAGCPLMAWCEIALNKNPILSNFGFSAMIAALDRVYYFYSIDEYIQDKLLELETAMVVLQVAYNREHDLEIPLQIVADQLKSLQNETGVVLAVNGWKDHSAPSELQLKDVKKAFVDLYLGEKIWNGIITIDEIGQTESELAKTKVDLRIEFLDLRFGCTCQHLPDGESCVFHYNQTLTENILFAPSETVEAFLKDAYRLLQSRILIRDISSSY